MFTFLSHYASSSNDLPQNNVPNDSALSGLPVGLAEPVSGLQYARELSRGMAEASGLRVRLGAEVRFVIVL
jgi:hypothetical protein